MVINWACQGQTSKFMHGFQNNLAQLFSLRSSNAIWNNCSGRLKVKVILSLQASLLWCQRHIRRSNYKMVINIFMQRFLNNLAQLLIWNICSGRLTVKVTLQMIKWSYIKLFRAITSIFMHEFQNNLAQLFMWSICLVKLKVRVRLEGQTIKWSLAYVNILNWILVQKYQKSLLSEYDVIWLQSNKWVKQFFTCL